MLTTYVDMKVFGLEHLGFLTEAQAYMPWLYLKKYSDSGLFA